MCNYYKILDLDEINQKKYIKETSGESREL